MFHGDMTHRGGSFEIIDEKEHAIRQRSVAPLHTQASMLKFEPIIERIY